MSDIQLKGNKMGYRWGNNPVTTMMSDFERVLSTLFAKHQTWNEDYVDSTKEGFKKGEKEALPIPTSPIEQLIHIWDLIYPQRKELVMTLVGNRKKILFTEGDKGSLDVALYQALYPNYFVVPQGSCDKVIDPRKRYAELMMSIIWRHMELLIGTLKPTDEELASLQAAGVHSLQVAEIENLLIMEEVVTLMDEIDGFLKEEIFPQVKTAILRSLAEELENQISLRSAKEIEFRLNTFDTKVKGKEALKQDITKLVDRVDVDEIYDLNEDLYTEILDTLDYAKGLQHYNRKSLLRFISSELKCRLMDTKNVFFEEYGEHRRCLYCKR